MADTLDRLADAALETRLGVSFYGAVILVTTVWPPWARCDLQGIIGTCQFIPAVDLLGIQPGRLSEDANWALLVTGEKVTMGLPGCQVRMVMRHEPGALSLNPMIQEVP